MRGLIQARLRRAATPPRQRSLTVVLAGVILAALLLPATALANHIFSDVPTGMTGHAAIEAIYDAGITGGCGGTRYCPTDAVTRAQMALFMQRGFPRVSYAPGLGSPIGTDDQGTVLNELLLTSGGGAGKSQFLKVDTTINLEVTDVTGCPCQVFAWLQIGDQVQPFSTAVTITAIGWYAIPSTFVAAVPTNTQVSALAVADIEPNTATAVINGYADMTAISAPFGSTGTDVLGDTAASPPKTGRPAPPAR